MINYFKNIINKIISIFRNRALKKKQKQIEKLNRIMQARRDIDQKIILSQLHKENYRWPYAGYYPRLVFIVSGCYSFDERSQHVRYDFITSKEIVETLPDYEKQFFRALQKVAYESKLKGYFECHLNTNDEYSVYYDDDKHGGWLGRLKLRVYPPTYAVMKDGNTRVTRVFKTKEEAETFIASKKNKLYKIIERGIQPHSYFTYLKRINSAYESELSDLPLEEYIKATQYWIKHIKKSKHY